MRTLLLLVIGLVMCYQVASTFSMVRMQSYAVKGGMLFLPFPARALWQMPSERGFCDFCGRKLCPECGQ